VFRRNILPPSSWLGCVDVGLPGCDTVRTCRQGPAFQRNILPPSSGLECVDVDLLDCNAVWTFR
jgi:hypothetical protein